MMKGTMADATKAKSAPPAPPLPGAELDARVTALLDEMQEASDRMIRHLDGSSPSQAAAPVPPKAPEAGPGVAADDLGRAVDQMIADARTARLPTGAIAALDQELAHRGDDLIDGEITDETEVLGTAAPAPVPVAVAPAPPPPPPAPPAAAPPVPRVNATPPPPSPSVPSVPVREPAIEPPAAEEPVTVPEPAARKRPEYGSRITASALATLAAASAPLDARPHLRPWIGYLAIWTLFNAVCLLGYNFFVREPSAPKPPAAAHVGKEASGSGDHGEPAKSDEKADAHGDEPAKTAKATPKRTRSALPKKDAHGGGH